MALGFEKMFTGSLKTFFDDREIPTLDHVIKNMEFDSKQRINYMKLETSKRPVDSTMPQSPPAEYQFPGYETQITEVNEAIR